LAQEIFQRKQGILSTFIADLHSGKLHREFHHGPDPTTTTEDPGVSRHTTFILFLMWGPDRGEILDVVSLNVNLL
jgi:endoplasmic reticulum resident protein 44